MASFRTGFKIFGELSLKQGLGRIRSFSEDRKPGQWLPEDQWAVRQPGSTCTEPSEKPKKPPKPSKSWLSICSDPDPPKELECDPRHNNCPSPPIRTEAPWYSLDNLIPKKKPQGKPQPLECCREEIKRREMFGEEEEVCEKIQDRTFREYIEPETPECIPKEPCPAPVVTLSCPLPKELDIMLWCGKPCTDTSRIAAKCQSDKLPYEEFRPQKCYKPPPFSLPTRGDSSLKTSCSCPGSIPYSEFKQVEVPKPLYTRYKSVKLSERNLILCMTDVKCPDDDNFILGVIPPPVPYCIDVHPEEPETEKKLECPEKPFVEGSPCKPVRIKKATKYVFRPKPTKLVEKRIYTDPFGRKKCDLPFRPQNEGDESNSAPKEESERSEPSKVLTGTLTDEPQTFERNVPVSYEPPKWMFTLSKPGSNDTPLVPKTEEFPKEPDWCSETDGLKFYDENNENITPKPPPDPCSKIEEEEERKMEELVVVEPEPLPEEMAAEPPSEYRNRYVLMPEKYNIKKQRSDEQDEAEDDPQPVPFEKFIEVKTAPTKKRTKSYPPMKENILYDLQRLCPNPPLDPSKLNLPCRKPTPPSPCPSPSKSCRGFSTFTASTLENLRPNQSCITPLRTECGDSSGKCKARKLIPKPRDCPEQTNKPDCAEIALPCCPKARIPPDCNVRRPMPICKKKLPPKPSFSECSKDPPPCPKMTECDCWEKKLGGKNRK